MSRSASRVYVSKPVGRSPASGSDAVSRSMKSNRASGTKPESVLSGYLRKKLAKNDLPGRPDFVYPSHRLAVFVHGCFWHRCPRDHLPLPKAHAAFWRRKFERNVERDRLNKKELEAMGWRVLVVWEHELRENPGRCARRVQAALEGLRRAHARR